MSETEACVGACYVLSLATKLGIGFLGLIAIGCVVQLLNTWRYRRRY